MICNNCRKAGDANTKWKKTGNKDYRSKSKVFHKQCLEVDCYCQHRK